MKRKILLLLGLVLALQMPLFTACDDDDDVAASDVPTAVMAAFTAKFPNAANVKWEKENGFYKADFYTETNETEAWFTPDGTWWRTETDLRPDQLPEAVSSYVATNYPDRIIEDCDLIETPEATFYLLELEKPAAADIHIKLTPDGGLIP